MVKVVLEQQTSYQSATARISENQPHRIPIREFTASEQANLFETIKQPQFSGQLVLRDIQGRESIFYLYLGRIIYATSSTHPVRRWRRNLALYCPEITSNISLIHQDLATLTAEGCGISWEYQALCLWVKQEKITRQQVAPMIRAVIIEVLFDLTQAGQITYELKPNRLSSTPLVLINTEQVIVETWKLWQAWQTAKLADRSPNLAPAIKQLKELKARTSPQTFQMLKLLLNGQVSLRDIAVNLKQDIVQVTRLLMLYIQSGLVSLVEIPDLAVPIQQLSPISPSIPSKPPLVGCIAHNAELCQTLKKTVTAANYEFFSTHDRLQAIAHCLAQQPDFIFIDSLLPHTDGYEVCRELRQFSIFRDTPIVIFTENIGIMERMKAKIAGCSDLLIKPFNPETVLSAIAKSLS